MQQQQIEGQRAQTILVVESDEATRRILDLSLRHAGFAVRVASNAEEGGRRLADRPDLIIVGADNDDGLGFLPAREAGRHAGARRRVDARSRRRQQAPRIGGGRGRFRRASDLRAGGRRAFARAAAATRSRAARAVGARQRTLRQQRRGRAARRSAARDRRQPEIGRRAGDGRRGRARRALLPSGPRRRRRGRPAVGARRRLPPVLLVVGQAGRRVEEHPAQGHDRDGDARPPDGGAATRGRVAAPARGRARARHHLRGRLPVARRTARRHSRRGEPHPASVRRRADLPAGDRRLRSARPRRAWRRSASFIANGSSTTSACPSRTTRR